jgi:EmrB/QacA subfamily drug resistance transporter
MNPIFHQACDRGFAQSSQFSDSQPSATKTSGWILAATILSSSLAFVDGSVVNVGMAAIGQSLQTDAAALTWVLSGYLLPLSALLLLGGAAGDHFGRRNVLTVGILTFALASLLCSLAGTSSVLLFGRVAQGVGAALVLPNSLAILGANFSGEARGRAIGIWAAIGAGSRAIGPVLGGWLIDVSGWRTIFLINLPIAAAAAVIALRYVPREVESNRAPLDVIGAALASLSLACLTWGLIQWSSSRHAGLEVFFAVAIGLVAAVLFLGAERRLRDGAMLPLDLFRSSDFVGLSLLTFFLYGAMGGLLVLIPYVLIESSGYSATQAGAALLPLPLTIAASSSTTGRLASRYGARIPLTLGPIITAVGFLLALRVPLPGTYLTTAFPSLMVIAIGMSIAAAPLTTAVLGSVPTARTGVASGFNSAVARTGGLVATALVGGVIAAQGSMLVGLFEIAAMAAATAAVVASACVFFWLSGPKA